MLTRERSENIRHTLVHRKAFRSVEKELFGRVSIRGYLHDLDKIFLYLFLGRKTVSKLHRRFSRHHVQRAKTRQDFEQMVIDWECAQYTKPDKPLNAYETLYALYPQLEDRVLPILKELGLAE